MDAAWSSIKDGSLKVFDTSKFTCQPAADGSYQVDADGHVTSAFGLDSDGDFVNDTGEAIVDGAFQESVLRSAPYFSLRIDGITELNNNQISNERGCPLAAPFSQIAPSPPRHRPPGSFFPFLFPPEARAAGMCLRPWRGTDTKRKDDLFGTYHCH